ncbi:hypothetical protein B7463_g4506, partial [Scytalidium lignicola]
MATVDLLDNNHLEIFSQALMNVLTTEVAEDTYAQIVDGLPTEESFLDFHFYAEGHPVFEQNHTRLCGGSLKKVQKFRSSFDPTTIEFKSALLEEFQSSSRDFSEFNIILINLVAVACHQIAVYLFQLDDGLHRHELHEHWLDKKRQGEEYDRKRMRGYILPPSTFYHNCYVYSDQYPNGVADVVGYWVEAKIFGGVVLFDRGKTDKEATQTSLSPWKSHCWPRTIYPPTTVQYEALLAFLLSMRDPKTPPPLPIYATRMNRWRYDPYGAMARFHIFRDRYERKLPESRPQGPSTQNSIDWPEFIDEMFLIRQSIAHSRGEPIDDVAVAEANERMNQITPSSPCWHP